MTVVVCQLGSRRGGSEPIPDLPLSRPDICPVAADGANVLRCRRSLTFAVGCWCCCHRCCQAAALYLCGRVGIEQVPPDGRDVIQPLALVRIQMNPV
jgi:hypothetical protein